MKYFAPRNAINLKIESEINTLMSTQYEVMGNSVNIADLGWKWEWDSAKRRFGRCMISKKLITISYPLVKENRDNLAVEKNIPNIRNLPEQPVVVSVVQRNFLLSSD